ncbi:MAG: CRISPR-associated endonuclease Cas2, partial [Proteobacteria bacterium]|nr:CRISPR-associated endonuclease Cas2 [Pseudomonadota bacterium]
MFVLIVYDVSTKDEGGARRLRRVAKTCEDYGIRVQNSVFECTISLTHWTQFKFKLLEEINDQEDSLRFYFLDQ